DENGLFPGSRVKFLQRLFSGHIDIEHVKIELKSQMDRAANSGAMITNLSSHEHLHMIPGIFRVLIGLAKEYGVRYIRVLRKEAIAPPFSLNKIFRSAVVDYFHPGMEKLLKKSGLGAADNFLGFLDSGAVGEDVLLRMIGSIKEGVTELVAHPGFLDPEVLYHYRFHINCEEELYALTGAKAKRAIADNGIKLCRYGDLGTA
ncbi:MAG: ChbG/HpnK family deacetylase, partial [Candidatus Omnitrophica bacterium]|nr:ChbG/HpnK family deacetylase [Candidatus Omnitrophota bacterium]